MSAVRIMPGEIELTRTVGPYSSAAFAVSAMTAALDAEYGASPAAGRVPLIDAVLTIRPSPLASRCGMQARKPWKTPVRLIATSRFHSSSGHSWMRHIELVPALLKRSERPPSFAAASSAAAASPS